MSVVVDLGCADRGDALSIVALADEYKPARIYGFDPAPFMAEETTEVKGVPVELSRAAAWLYDGEVGYSEAGSSSSTGNGGPPVPCFDFPAWLAALLERENKVVVKMDIEGAEEQLVPALISNGTATKLQELLLEWHDPKTEAVMAEIPCPVRRWWM